MSIPESDLEIRRFATPGDVEIAYTDEGDGAPVLLIMGISLHLVHWPASLCALLRDAGFRLIRFDNRDCGESSKLDHLGTPTASDILLGVTRYTLDDMGEDGFALLDHLGLASAHIVGVSMGGMIAQTMALHRPERVRSLTLIMTTPGGIYLPRVQALRVFLNRSEVTREALGQRFLANQRIFAGPGAPPLGGEDEIVRLGQLIFDRSGGPPKPAWFFRQLSAIRVAPHRGRGLSTLKVPTRIIHGALDPLVPPRAGFDLAKLIPRSDLHVINGLGHVMPQWARPRIAELISDHIHKDA
ncbi:MAG: alpha/beta hydrolase [Myxococcota bacterium]